MSATTFSEAAKGFESESKGQFDKIAKPFWSWYEAGDSNIGLFKTLMHLGVVPLSASVGLSEAVMAAGSGGGIAQAAAILTVSGVAAATAAGGISLMDHAGPKLKAIREREWQKPHIPSVSKETGINSVETSSLREERPSVSGI
jgi:hypothetical protein